MDELDLIPPGPWKKAYRAWLECPEPRPSMIFMPSRQMGYTAFLTMLEEQKTREDEWLAQNG